MTDIHNKNKLDELQNNATQIILKTNLKFMAIPCSPNGPINDSEYIRIPIRINRNATYQLP